uniref:Uncharacterized protein n=1 Tax=Sphaerodactylus townsendi TaxID=933632 RepID=A0ACB8GBH9_9SAUR
MYRGSWKAEGKKILLLLEAEWEAQKERSSAKCTREGNFTRETLAIMWIEKEVLESDRKWNGLEKQQRETCQQKFARRQIEKGQKFFWQLLPCAAQTSQELWVCAEKNLPQEVDIRTTPGFANYNCSMLKLEKGQEVDSSLSQMQRSCLCVSN